VLARTGFGTGRSCVNDCCHHPDESGNASRCVEGTLGQLVQLSNKFHGRLIVNYKKNLFKF
jgi:hypothetical protein